MKHQLPSSLKIQDVGQRSHAFFSILLPGHPVSDGLIVKLSLIADLEAFHDTGGETLLAQRKTEGQRTRKRRGEWWLSRSTTSDALLRQSCSTIGWQRVTELQAKVQWMKSRQHKTSNQQKLHQPLQILCQYWKNQLHSQKIVRIKWLSVCIGLSLHWGIDSPYLWELGCSTLGVPHQGSCHSFVQADLSVPAHGPLLGHTMRLQALQPGMDSLWYFIWCPGGNSTMSFSNLKTVLSSCGRIGCVAFFTNNCGWATCLRLQDRGLRWIRTCDPPVTRHRTYHYTTASHYVTLNIMALNKCSK